VSSYYLEGARWGYRLGNQELVVACIATDFFAPLAKMSWARLLRCWPSNIRFLATKQDEYALLSQTRAGRAIKAGRFDNEVVPVTIEGTKGATTFSRDEHPFSDPTIEKLGKLTPVFSNAGTITAGNSSASTDGAAAVMVAGENFVKRNNLKRWPASQLWPLPESSHEAWESARSRPCAS